MESERYEQILQKIKKFPQDSYIMDQNKESRLSQDHQLQLDSDFYKKLILQEHYLQIIENMIKHKNPQKFNYYNETDKEIVQNEFNSLPYVQYNNFQFPKYEIDEKPQFNNHMVLFTSVTILLVFIICVLVFLLIKVIRMLEKNHEILRRQDTKLDGPLQSSERELEDFSTKSRSQISRIQVFQRDNNKCNLQRKFSSPTHSRNYKNEQIYSQRNIQKIDGENEESKEDLMQALKKEFFNQYVQQQKMITYQKNETDKQIFFENNKFKNCFTHQTVIGSGSFGQVYRAMHILEEYFYAVKKIRLELPKEFDLRSLDIYREISTMVKLQHKNIVRFITSWAEQGENIDTSIKESFNETDLSIHFGNTEILKPQEFVNGVDVVNLFIQMEYCDGMSLNSYLLNPLKTISESSVFYLFKQILEGIIYIHQKGIIHRDLKPSNIFINDSEIKIGDFGLATISENNYELLNTQTLSNQKIQKTYIQKQSNQCLQYSMKIGTPLYNAPEQEETPYYDNKVDVYSLGVILYELQSGFKTASEKIKKITNLKVKGKVDDQFRDNFPQVSELIELMIQRDPQLRPTSKQIQDLQPFKIWECNVDVTFQLIINENYHIHFDYHQFLITRITLILLRRNFIENRISFYTLRLCLLIFLDPDDIPIQAVHLSCIGCEVNNICLKNGSCQNIVNKKFYGVQTLISLMPILTTIFFTALYFLIQYEYDKYKHRLLIGRTSFSQNENEIYNVDDESSLIDFYFNKFDKDENFRNSQSSLIITINQFLQYYYI